MTFRYCKFSYTILFAFYISAVCFAPNSVLAEEEAEVDAKSTTSENLSIEELNAITVTASRVEQKVKEASVTLNILPQAEIEKVRYSNPTQLLQRLPGVLSYQFGGESELTSIRVPTHFTNPYTITLYDGLPISPYGSGSSSQMSEINSDDIAQIEVLKGPASALYGSNAIGGTINVISKRPSDEPEGRLWSEYGEFGHWKYGISGSGSTDRFGFFAGATYSDINGWTENSAYDKKVGNLKAEYYPSEDSAITFKLDALNSERDLQGSLSREDFETNWRQNYHTFAYNETERIAPSLRYTRVTDRSEVRAAIAYRHKSEEGIANYGIRRQGPMFVGSLAEDKEDVANAQFVYSHRFEPLSSRVVLGADFERGESDSRSYSLAVTYDRMLNKYIDYSLGELSKSYDVETLAGAPYLQIEAMPFDDFKVSAGGRLDLIKYDVSSPLADGVNDNKDFSQFSPKVGLVYDVDYWLNTYATYSEGFVVPTTSQLLTSSWSNSELDPEKARNYEVGLRSSFLDQRVRLDIALFYMEVDDKIVTQNISAWAQQYVNAGKTSHRGVEVLGVIQPIEQVRLSLAYTYAENKFEEYATADADLADNYMPRAPKQHLNARVALLPIEGLEIELELDTVSSQYADNENLYSYSRPTLVNLRSSYDWNNWSLWVHVLNITDREYASYVSDSSTLGGDSFYSGTPITLFTGISYKFSNA